MSEQKQAEKILLEKLNKALEKRGYQYEMPLGRGSFGLVVKARELNAPEESTYAIKCLSLVNGETAKYRKRELKILQENGIKHENIVKYGKYFSITIDKIPYLCITMECCRVHLKAFIYNNKLGDAEIIKTQGPPRFYQHVFPQILRGLKAIHDAHWVHRDIHLSNILIANPNPEEIGDITIKIADFGLARHIRPTTSESLLLTESSKLEKLSTNIGNKDFRAPELDDGYYDYKVDLYSAGIVLYFLSRYLEVQGQWKDEIKAFVQGRRSSEYLHHQDDKHLVRLISLLMQNQEKRPCAKEALKIAEKLGESGEHVASQMLVEPKQLEFLVKKYGERASDRRWIKATILTLSNLKAEIEKCTGIKADSQELQQQVKDAELINIKSDEDVEHIFKETPVFIIASDSTKTENRNVKKFRVKKLGESTWERCSTPDNTLSSLKAAIQHCLGVEVESQKLEQQQTTASGKDRTIAIRTDQNVEEMFESAEKKQDPVEIVVSDADGEEIMQNKTKTFWITKAGEWTSKRCSIQECTLLSFKEEITRQTGIPTDLQVLNQLKIIHKYDRYVPIDCDKDVDNMFRSAEESPDVYVNSEHMSVSESENQTDGGNDPEKTFFIQKRGLRECTRLTMKENALNLSCLKEEIEKITKIETKSQGLHEKTTINGELALINITTDDDVKMVGKTGGDSVILVSHTASIKGSDMMFL